MVVEIFDPFHNLPCVVADCWLIVLERPPLLLQESRETSWEGEGRRKGKKEEMERRREEKGGGNRREEERKEETR